MTIPLFDVQADFGGALPGQRDFPSAEDLAGRLRRAGIERALVRITPTDLECDQPRGNRKLLEACSAHKNFVPCPVVVPGTGGGIPPEPQQVDELLAQGAVAVCIRPAQDGWCLLPWVSGRLFEALQERRLPLLCLERFVGLDAVGDLAGRYPRLPLILAEVGYRSQRVILPLLETFPNVHLSIGRTFAVHRGIETTVERLGPERLLFGTGLAGYEPMLAVSMLLYCHLGDDPKRLIASGNLDRLIGGIAR